MLREKKPGTKGHVLCDSNDEMSGLCKSVATDDRLVVVRGWVRAEWECLLTAFFLGR